MIRNQGIRNNLASTTGESASSTRNMIVESRTCTNTGMLGSMRAKSVLSTKNKGAKKNMFYSKAMNQPI